jgi:hypothetical protein
MLMVIFGCFLILLAIYLIIYETAQPEKENKKEELYPDRPAIYEAYYNRDYKYDIPFYILNNPDFSILYYE